MSAGDGRFSLSAIICAAVPLLRELAVQFFETAESTLIRAVRLPSI
jgi:hypothetical protein